MAEELKRWELNPDDYRGGKTRTNIRRDLQRQRSASSALRKALDLSSYHDDQLTDTGHHDYFSRTFRSA